jgi:hypothetical protein
MLLNSKMLVVVIIFILTFALIGGVVYFSTKKNEEPEGETVPNSKNPYDSVDIKEPAPAPEPEPEPEPEPIDCKIEWGPWSQCSALCVTDGSGSTKGTQKRSEIKVIQEPKNGGKSCKDVRNEEGYKACNSATAKWTNKCTENCVDKGTESQPYVITDPGSDGGVTCPGPKVKNCQKDCRVTNYRNHLKHVERNKYCQYARVREQTSISCIWDTINNQNYNGLVPNNYPFTISGGSTTIKGPGNYSRGGGSCHLSPQKALNCYSKGPKPSVFKLYKVEKDGKKYVKLHGYGGDEGGRGGWCRHRPGKMPIDPLFHSSDGTVLCKYSTGDLFHY